MKQKNKNSFALLTFYSKWGFNTELTSRDRRRDEQLQQFLGHLFHSLERPKVFQVEFLKARPQNTDHWDHRDKEKIHKCSTHFRTDMRSWLHTVIMWKLHTQLSPRVYIYGSFRSLYKLSGIESTTTLCLEFPKKLFFPSLGHRQYYSRNGIEKLVSPSLLIKATEKVL